MQPEVLPEARAILCGETEPWRTAAAAREPSIRSVDDVPLLGQCGGQEIRYVLEPLLPEGAAILLSGDSGCGKSTLATYWAGEASLTRPTVILDRENPLPIVTDRFRRLRIQDGPTLRYWGGWLPEEAPHPGSAIILAWALRCDPKPLVVVDSLIAFHGGDENGSSETRAFMQHSRRLADLGATVILVHHTGKAETAKDYRGSSDIKASVDVAYHLSNFSSDGRLDTLRLRPFKSRYGLVQEFVFRYRDGQFITDERPAAATVTEQLVTLLRGHPGIRVAEFERLAAERGLGRNRARQFVNDGVAAGEVSIRKGDKNTKLVYWGMECSGLF